MPKQIKKPYVLDEYFEVTFRMHKVHMAELYMYFPEILKAIKEKRDVSYKMMEALLATSDKPFWKTNAQHTYRAALKSYNAIKDLSHGLFSDFEGEYFIKHPNYPKQGKYFPYSMELMVHNACESYGRMRLFYPHLKDEKDFCLLHVYQRLEHYAKSVAPKHRKLLNPNRLRYMTAIIAHVGFQFIVMSDFNSATNAERSDAVRNAVGDFSKKGKSNT